MTPPGPASGGRWERHAVQSLPDEPVEAGCLVEDPPSPPEPDPEVLDDESVEELSLVPEPEEPASEEAPVPEDVEPRLSFL